MEANSAGKSAYSRIFHDRELPEPARPAGYSWLIEHYALRVPLPPRLAGIAAVHHRVESADWLLLTPRHAPDDTLSDQLTFALKWEGVELSVLSALARAISADEIAAAIRTAPNSRYLRRAWFLFEWLLDATLDIPDADPKRAIEPVLDPAQQFALATGDLSARHRIRNTLPGTREFCPLVRVTSAITRARALELDVQARRVIGRTHPDVVARAGAFLQLSDSKASFAIEQERPSPDRARRWAAAIARAGSEPVTLTTLEALQRVVIGDDRFVHLGLRTEGGFIGDHDRDRWVPLPEHISARAGDLLSLVRGMEAFDTRVRRYGFDPVVAAAALAFGFVYVHPFEDGNGRIHRWLIHHVLAAAGYTPVSVVFPVSAAMLRELDRYRQVLESYSRPLLPCIEWRATPQGNVEVLNETGTYYRYFDATAHAEFLYHCVEETVSHDLPAEVAYLEAYDHFVAEVQRIVNMPAHTVELLHRFLRQNGGKLSQRARDKEFRALTAQEVGAIEEAYAAGR